MKRVALRIAVAGLIMGTMSHSAFAGNEKITLMVGGMEKQIYLPAKLAEQLGYFKEQGLDVELLNEPAGVDAETQRRAGHPGVRPAPAVVGGGQHADPHAADLEDVAGLDRADPVRGEPAQQGLGAARYDQGYVGPEPPQRRQVEVVGVQM